MSLEFIRYTRLSGTVCDVLILVTRGSMELGGQGVRWDQNRGKFHGKFSFGGDHLQSKENKRRSLTLADLAEDEAVAAMKYLHRHACV